MESWTCVATFACLLPVAGGLPSQAPAAAKTPPRVEVRCVDTDGKPVGGAEVHLFQARKSPDGRSDYVASGPHVSDADGRAITDVAIDYDGGRFDRWCHARVPGKLVGAQRALRFDVNAPAPTLTIRMEPARDVRGRVMVPDGLAATSVRVRMLSLHVLGGESAYGMLFPRESELNGLTRTLPELFDAAVAADGTFTLRDLPPRMRLYLAAEGPGLAQAQWSNVRLPELRMPDVIEFTMARESSIEGTVRGPDGRALADASVQVRLQGGNRNRSVMSAFDTRSDATGRFRIGGLPDGEVSLVVTSTAGVMRPQGLTLTEAGALRTDDVNLEVGVEVRGTVRRTPDGAAVESVSVCAITDGDQQWRMGWTRTNGEGRFALRLPTGGCRLYIAGVPAGYQQPSSRTDDLLRLDVKPGDASLTDVRFEIDRAK